MSEDLRKIMLKRIERWEQRGRELQSSPVERLHILGIHYLDRADELRHDLDRIPLVAPVDQEEPK